MPLMGMLGFLSCEKNDDPTAAGPVQIAFVHAAAGAGSVDVALNGSLLNSTGIQFGTSSGVTGRPYYSTNKGLNSVRISIAGEPVFQKNVLTIANKSYSIFYYDTLGSGTAPMLMMLPDLLTAQLGADTAQIRLLHLSHDAGTIDVRLAQTGSNTLVADSLTYIGSNPNAAVPDGFVKVRAGTYNVSVKSFRALSPFFTTSLNLAAGKTYTLFTKGSRVAAPSSTFTFGIGQFLHN
jgi:hypothetical protein